MAEAVRTALNSTNWTRCNACVRELLPALQRLDSLLEGAVALAQQQYGEQAACDPYRGLYISPEDVARLLARDPGAPILYVNKEERSFTESVDGGARLSWIQRNFDLSAFDLDLVLIALAPELDLRYERLYAFLQDDVSKKRPTVDLALHLLCTDAEERLIRREHFASSAPLFRHALMHLLTDPHQTEPPLLSHFMKLDEQIVNFLLGQDGLERRLSPFCRLTKPSVSLDELTLREEVKIALLQIAHRDRERHRPLRLYFHGPPGVGKRRTAEALAGEMGVLLCTVDLAQALVTEMNFHQVVRLIFREARFRDALLYLGHLDALRVEGCELQYGRLMEALARDKSLTILSGRAPWVPLECGPMGMLSVPFPIPDFPQRRYCWRNHLTKEGIHLKEGELETLASRFRLTPHQIAEAIASACNHAYWLDASQGSSGDDGRAPKIGDLFEAARAQSGHDLEVLAHKIEPVYTWADIVLPQDTLAQLHEICQRVEGRHLVLGEWGFDRKLSLGKGVTALFAGPSGTGKTMAAEILARELGLDLYKIDLSGVVSKYIGETEKNLDRIFGAAENANAILFFDEADALFGKRSEVRDSHDRYANIEIAYLMQKMEAYEGIAILATNLHRNLDEAFLRRMAFTVYFPFPDEASRLRIWRGIWPAETPLEKDLAFGLLAQQFKLSGGNIKNIALAAAFLASEDGHRVTMDHLLQATRREYQKMGKDLTEGETKGLTVGRADMGREAGEKG